VALKPFCFVDGTDALRWRLGMGKRSPPRNFDKSFGGGRVPPQLDGVLELAFQIDGGFGETWRLRCDVSS
ncbi:hypothetical protein, partial [Mesorhizobium sp. M1A.T.Ca.IN.004.03.1.1]|uniref:hypothetical protein n=1 Tax=Mesorhizobium sp. M1A.T.Ca.IN.004.03.1.1 TaxID=2496795 RepID=UPI0019D24D51